MAFLINGKNPIPPGPPGLSPYQVAAAGGYTGTEEEFNAILAGIASWAAKADAALPKIGGTMTGNLVAAPKTDLTAVGVVNTVAVTDVANVPADLPNGSLVAVVEAAAATALTYDVIPVEEDEV